MGSNVFVDDHSSGIGVYFYTTEIKGKAVGQGGVNFVVGRGGSEFRSAPVGGFPHGRFHVIRQAAGRPVGESADASEFQAIVRIRLGLYPAVFKFQICCGYVHLTAGDAGHLLPHLHCSFLGGAGRGRCKPAGVVTGGNRPVVFLRIGLQVDRNVIHADAEFVSNDLGQRCLMPLSLRCRVTDHADRTQCVDADGAGSDGTVFGSCTLTFVMGFESGDIAHVRLAWLYCTGVANAINFALGPALVSALKQVCKVALLGRIFDHFLVVAGIEQ